MKLRIHHIEMCVKDPERTLRILTDQFAFQLVATRDTPLCSQKVVQAGKKIFVITHKSPISQEMSYANTNQQEPWTIFCCEGKDFSSNVKPHIDSVFNIAIQVFHLRGLLQHLRKQKDCVILRDFSTVGAVHYAILKTICGNIVHTLIEKNDCEGGFLPGFEAVTTETEPNFPRISQFGLTSHFDHVSLACEAGDSNKLIEWYSRAFGMRRFMTNRQESEETGLMISGEVGMRLKVMEFWRCSEIGLTSEDCADAEFETLKIVIVESLPNTSNTQIDVFIRGHEGPGLQHIGLYTPDIVGTVEKMAANGVKFRCPPPAYYTSIGQLAAILASGENLEMLQKCGILLDSEADPESDVNSNEKYLMQIFTYPIFDRDTFFLEVIQRQGAKGFGVGNVTALARSINAYNIDKSLGNPGISNGL